jgi:hypothetical protein
MLGSVGSTTKRGKLKPLPEGIDSNMRRENKVFLRVCAIGVD